MSSSLRPHGPQHSRPPCPSLSPGVCSDSCPLSQWCCLTISSSVSLFSFCYSLSQHQDSLQLVGASHQVAKYWSFSFNISPSNDYSGLISLRTDWFDLLADQGTLKESSPAPQFFRTQSSLWSDSLSKFAIAFLPRSKCLNFMAVITIHSDSGAQENLSLLLLFPLLFAMKFLLSPHIIAISYLYVWDLSPSTLQYY